MTVVNEWALSPENLKVWNRFGLTMTNGTVTMSVPALDLLLNTVRRDARSDPSPSQLAGLIPDTKGKEERGGGGVT
jgi:hypothetical protein